jgi:hypothetical protein
VEVDLENWNCDMVGAAGVWMISKCPPGWASDELKTKCENVPSKFSYPVEDFIPVIGVTGETYRNKHCSFCNGVESYTASDFEVNTFVIPPDEFDLDSKLKFIMDNGGGGIFRMFDVVQDNVGDPVLDKSYNRLFPYDESIIHGVCRRAC